MRDEPGSGILASVHKVVVGLHETDLVDEATRRDFDLMRLLTAERPGLECVRSLRSRG